jgi:hypothetical protein
VADLIQDLLICMEMLVASVAFLNSFPIMEFAKVRQLNWDSRGQGGVNKLNKVYSNGTLLPNSGKKSVKVYIYIYVYI